MDKREENIIFNIKSYFKFIYKKIINIRENYINFPIKPSHRKSAPN
jgi:hypothetical protein